MLASPKVEVILGTYNGEKHIQEQIGSILGQTHPVDKIIVSDDCSTDATISILQEIDGPIEILNGPKQGYATNYLSLFRRIHDDAGYVALSDQDDVWLPTKIERAVDALQNVDNNKPAIYGTSTIVCDEKLNKLRNSRRVDSTRLGFRNALVQNFAGGNTFVLNKAAVRLVQKTMPAVAPVHDWWLYLIVSGAGGHIIYDDEPSLLYRQHDGNIIGANFRAMSHVKRTKAMLSGIYRTWNDLNFDALDGAKEVLTPDAKKCFEIVKEYRELGVGYRLSLPLTHGLRRHGKIGQIGLYLSLLLKKF